MNQSVGLSARTRTAIVEALGDAPGTPRTRQFFLFAGPAIIASVAYMDPGNYATNIQAGAKYGYALLWVVVVANVIAMLFQALSAKLGIATGKSLAEQCRDHLPRPLVIAMWLVSEFAAMATDLAEFLGGAIGLSLLFHLPLLAGMVVTAICTYALLASVQVGFRGLELAISVFVGVIALCFLFELVVAPVDWSKVLIHGVRPNLPDLGALNIAVGIIGATVMPHAIFLHSSLMKNRGLAPTVAGRQRQIRFSNIEVIVALSFAGLINIAMVVMAASVFYASGHSDIAEIETAYRILTPLLGAGAASMFLLSLLASGLSSSAVGTLAGQGIMEDFLHRRIPLWLRRLITMVPAFAVVAAGIDSTRALVVSQIVLSFALPVPMLALLYFTRRRDVMGEFANSRLLQACALGGSVLVIVLNVALIVQTFIG